MPENVLSDLCVLERMRLHMQAKLDAIIIYSVSVHLLPVYELQSAEPLVSPLSSSVCLSHLQAGEQSIECTAQWIWAEY